MSFDISTNESLNSLEDLDLDQILGNNENRKNNNFGLYRINCLCIGGTGSGKTTYLIKSLLSDFISHYSLILVFIPEESKHGLWGRVFKIYKERFIPIVIGNNQNSSLLPIEEINNISKEIGGEIAVVIDDFINVFNKYDWLMLKRYITQLSRVENGASLFCLIQDIHSLPVAYRKNFNVFIVFPSTLTYLQFSDILSNYFNSYTFTDQQKKELYILTKEKQHLALTLINNNSTNCIKIGFKDLIINH